MTRADPILRPALLVLGAFHLALGAFQAFAPHAFHDAVGPFGAANDHYVRDVATWTIALGVVLLLAVRRPSWRVPVLAFAALQYLLHTVNHLLDVGDADPAWLGPFDAVTLAALSAVLLWLLHTAARTAGRG